MRHTHTHLAYTQRPSRLICFACLFPMLTLPHFTPAASIFRSCSDVGLSGPIIFFAAPPRSFSVRAPPLSPPPSSFLLSHTTSLTTTSRASPQRHSDNIADLVAGTALCESPCADLVAGTALCEPPCADLVAGTALCCLPKGRMYALASAGHRRWMCRFRGRRSTL